MRRTHPQRRSCRPLVTGLVFALLLAACAATAGVGRAQSATSACPLTASELSTIVGRTLQRVNLSDVDADPAAQCAFSVVPRAFSKRLSSPQVFLTVDPGGAGDLRELYQYYLQARAKLATRPRVSTRPDLGAGAFTLAATTNPVTTAFFLVGRGGIGTLTVDLEDAAVGKRDQATADKVFALVHSRLH